MGKGWAAGGIRLEPEYIWHILLAAWLLVIFGHSATPAEMSSAESGHVLQLISDFLENVGAGSGWLTEHLVRKAAHFCEYGVFGMLLLANFRVLQKKNRGYRQKADGFFPLAFAVMAVPFLDETIQTFSPGRSPQISDVWLDMAGACCGLLAAGIWRKLQVIFRIRRRKDVGGEGAA